MIFEGLKLMALGMIIVYIFLIVLMFCVMASARIFKNRDISPPTLVSNVKTEHDKIVAVVSAAIAAFRAKNQDK